MYNGCVHSSGMMVGDKNEQIIWSTKQCCEERVSTPDLVFSTPFHIQWWITDAEDRLGSIITDVVVNQTVADGTLQYRLTSLCFPYEAIDRFHSQLQQLVHHQSNQAKLCDMDMGFSLCFQVQQTELLILRKDQQVNLQVNLVANSNLVDCKKCLEDLNQFPKWW